MKKKAFALFSLIIALLLPVQAFAAAIDYRDVAATAWYADAVEYVSDEGLMSGTENELFSPNQPPPAPCW